MCSIYLRAFLLADDVGQQRSGRSTVVNTKRSVPYPGGELVAAHAAGVPLGPSLLEAELGMKHNYL